MLQHVNSVLISNTINTTTGAINTATLAKGALVAVNDKGALINPTTAIADTTYVKFGVVRSVIDSAKKIYDIKWGNPIQKQGVKSIAYTIKSVAPVQDKVVITLTNAEIVAGHRYVLRVVYKDIYEAPGQFTHTYEVFATNTIASDLASAIVAKINKHKNRRIDASASAAVITLTAKAKDDNNGVYSLNEYSTVSMEASLYVTIPGALLSNQPEAVKGAAIVKTPGNPGKGYWKQVRDAEVRYMGYEGHVFTGAYPQVMQDMMTVEDTAYATLTISNENAFLSNDNQYIKNTPITSDIYSVDSTNIAKVATAMATFSGIAATNTTPA